MNSLEFCISFTNKSGVCSPISIKVPKSIQLTGMLNYY